MIFALFSAFLAVGLGQNQSPQDTPTMRADVNLILLQATASDNGGNPVPGLDKKAFHLFVDGKERPITVFQADDSPVTAGLIMDNSASMMPKRSEVLAAAQAFARASNPQDQMFVVHFSDQARLGLPPGNAFTGSISDLETALASFNAEGTTALYDALHLGLSHLREATVDRKMLLLISDGGDNSSHTGLQDVLKQARESGYSVYSIGIYDDMDSDRNPRVLRELAEVTGGKAFFPTDLKDITSVCEEIAREVRRQYTLGFEGEEDGRYHRIQVTVEDPWHTGLGIRTRSGYYAPTPSGDGAEVQSASPGGR
jgi:Ca-activated chloride channel family protein